MNNKTKFYLELFVERHWWKNHSFKIEVRIFSIYNFFNLFCWIEWKREEKKDNNTFVYCYYYFFRIIDEDNWKFLLKFPFLFP